MHSLIIYIAELNLALSALLIIYFVLFKRDANFQLRRLYLLGGLLLSAFLPLIHIELNQEVFQYRSPIMTLEEIVITASSGSETFSRGPAFWLSLFYITVSGFLAVRFIILLSLLSVKILRAPKYSYQGRAVHRISTLHASSFFRFIFLDPETKDEKELDTIFRHELEHVRHLHSFDRIILEIIQVVSWFNPLFFLYKKAVITNHEYQSDNLVTDHLDDTRYYQMTLLNQYLGRASMTNQFSHQIKSRIKMLNMNYKKSSNWKSLLFLPFIAGIVFIVSCGNNTENTPTAKAAEESASDKITEEQIFYTVDEMPMWADGSDMAASVRSFILKNLTYPQSAKQNGAEGKVFIQFIVNANGEVTIPTPDQLPPELKEDGKESEVVVVAYRPLDTSENEASKEDIEAFKNEGIRVVEMIPDMIPGKVDGKPVSVIFTFPIVYKLQ